LQSILTLFWVGSSHAFKTFDWAKMPQPLEPYSTFFTGHTHLAWVVSRLWIHPHSWYHDTISYPMTTQDSPVLDIVNSAYLCYKVTSILKKMPMKIHTHIVISIINLCCYPLFHLLSI
jgi:hypothetical protein